MMARFGCIQVLGWSLLADPPTNQAWAREIVFDVRAEHGILIEREQKMAVYEASGYVQIHAHFDQSSIDVFIDVRAAGPVYCEVGATEQVELDRVLVLQRTARRNVEIAINEARGRAIMAISSMLIKQLVRNGDKCDPRILRD